MNLMHLYIMVTTIALVNTSHNHHFLSMVRTIKIYPPRHFEIYNSVLLTIIPMLCIRSPGLIHLLIPSMCLLEFLSFILLFNYQRASYLKS